MTMAFDFSNWTVIKKDSVDSLDNPRIFVGCMTGMSVDSHADFSLVVFDELSSDHEHGLPIAYRNIHHAIPHNLQQRLAALSRGDTQTIAIRERSQVEADFSLYLSQAFLQVIDQAGLSDYPKDRIVLSPHGQAIDHQPLADPPYSDVLVNGDYLAKKTGYSVVSRHRQMPLVVSLAAPLAPVLIRHLFFSTDKHRVLLNGGAIANICVLFSTGELVAYDTGPANGPMDALIAHILTHWSSQTPKDLLGPIQKQQCDVDGQWAARGTVIDELFDALCKHNYFQRAHREKSADRAAFDLPWIMPLTEKKTYAWQDILATVAEVVAWSIAKAILQVFAKLPAREVEVIVYGGLSHNQYVMQRLADRLNKARQGDYFFSKISNYGYDADYFEALLMAYLGFCAYHHMAVDLRYCARESCDKAWAIPGSLSVP